ncbi:hypothetical protein ACEQ8H_008588, partial [Pleosporales sp. CAS-2024a]
MARHDAEDSDSDTEDDDDDDDDSGESESEDQDGADSEVEVDSLAHEQEATTTKHGQDTGQLQLHMDGSEWRLPSGA